MNSLLWQKGPCFPCLKHGFFSFQNYLSYFFLLFSSSKHETFEYKLSVLLALFQLFQLASFLIA